MEIKVKIKKLHPDAKIPTLGTEDSAGFDIYSIEEIKLMPRETKSIPTGIAMELPKGKVCFIWDRSGMGSKGIHRFAGLIDSDYRGEIKIVLNNNSEQEFKISKGDRIAQAVIQDYYKPEFEETSELSGSERGDGGFGHTGR